MAVVRNQLFGMTTGGIKLFRWAGVAIFFLAAAVVRPEPPALPDVKDGHSTDFTSEQYFDPPHERQLKMRLSGASSETLPGGLLEVKRLKIEMFTLTNSAAIAVVQAPQCTFAPLDGVASSAGHLAMQTGNGQFRVEGDGFLWRQNEQSLNISNHVRTLIEMPQ